MLAMSASGWVMDEEMRIHLFEPFFRAKEYGRTPGLELAMVYGIVKQSGGQIAVESQLGLGTTFRIYLPLVEHTMQAADSDYFPCVVPCGQMNGFTLEFISLGAGRLVPGPAQKFPS